MERPQTSLISFFSNKVKENGGINLAQGIPAFQPPQALLDIFKSEVSECRHQYPAGNGYFPLLEEITKSFNEYASTRINGKPVTKDNLIITQGATEGITLLYTYLKYKHGHLTTLAFEPVYESYRNLPKIFDQKFISLPVLPEIDFELFEKKLISEQVQLVFVNSPGNPLGKVWTKTELETLLQICLKHRVYVILDAVYDELFYEDRPYYALDQLNDYIFYVGSFSKIYCITAWRVGYILFSNQHREGLRYVHDYTGLCATEIHQRALASYVNQYQWGMTYVEQMRQRLKINYQFMKSELESLGFEVAPIQGGCFIWTKLPESFQDGFEFAVNLYDQVQVAVVPGIHFSETSGAMLRLNIARPMQELQQAQQLIKKYINTKY